MTAPASRDLLGELSSAGVSVWLDELSRELLDSGQLAGMADPLPMLTIFDKQIQLRMGQANVHRWVEDLLPLLTDDDPLGVDGFATHHLPLDRAPEAYATFQRRDEGMVKVLFQP